MGPLARFHLSGNARTGDMCCSRHIPSGRRPDGICSRESDMALEYILGAAVTLGLFAYLVYALLRPERF